MPPSGRPGYCSAPRWAGPAHRFLSCRGSVVRVPGEDRRASCSLVTTKAAPGSEAAPGPGCSECVAPKARNRLLPSRDRHEPRKAPGQGVGTGVLERSGALPSGLPTQPRPGGSAAGFLRRSFGNEVGRGREPGASEPSRAGLWFGETRLLPGKDPWRAREGEATVCREACPGLYSH